MILDVQEGDLIHYKVNQYDVETGRLLGGWGGTVSSLKELEEKKGFPPHSSERLHTIFGVKYVTRSIVCPECYEKQDFKLPKPLSIECENCKEEVCL